VIFLVRRHIWVAHLSRKNYSSYIYLEFHVCVCVTICVGMIRLYVCVCVQTDQGDETEGFEREGLAMGRFVINCPRM
jgi:hypothetical protein